MLYTSRPLERIYAAPSVFDHSKQEKGKEENKSEYRDVLLPSGRLLTRREGESYIIERINSTDMQDYLNASYSPGQSYKEGMEE